ncbi:hypothetical protein WJX84_001684 [Apatococcus fuscideae]|uniref:Glycosyl transferase family 3 domain-containing protein n=1 Tax=Apatococcus fuscideae TaxID=2026836 RepID=A0AAW1SPT0_9CHLO
MAADLCQAAYVALLMFWRMRHPLLALGVSVELGPESICKCLDAHNIGFMFAPRYHPAMKAVSPVRRALRIRTAFNLLGPLLNPARPPFGLIGIYSPSIAPLMAAALQGLGTRRALVVHSGGLDELTPLADADVLEVTPAGTRSFKVEPQRMGIQRCTVEDLKGGDAALNACILRDAFAGKKGAVADALCLNAGFALAACQVTDTPEDGVALAQETQASRISKKALKQSTVYVHAVAVQM